MVLLTDNVGFGGIHDVKNSESSLRMAMRAIIEQPDEVEAAETSIEESVEVKPENSVIEDKEEKKQKFMFTGWGVRHTQALIVFMGLSMSFMIRMNLALAIVGMESSHTSKINLTPVGKALAVSSFFMGYSVLQIPAGNLGRKGYAVVLFSLANILSGLLSILLPYAAITFGVVGIVFIRLLTGVLQGFVYPNVNNIMSRWTVPEERDSVMCLVHTGNPFGSLLVLVISGYLNRQFDWPSIFYATGVLGIICGIIMIMIAKDYPDMHEKISAEEKEFIVWNFDEEYDLDYMKNVEVPWKQILTSKPVIAMIFCAWCSYWGGWTLSLLTPSYINGVLRFEIDDNGLLSALPYLLCCIFSVLISIVSRYLKKNDLIADKIMRPIWNSIGMLGSSIPIVVIAFIPVSAFWAITLMTMSASLFVACNVGFMVNHIDLSPRFAGVLMSVMNSIGNTASLLGPLVSTWMIKDDRSQEDWRNVFLLCGFMFFFGNAVFVLFGSTRKQPWDIGKKNDVIQL